MGYFESSDYYASYFLGFFFSLADVVASYHYLNFGIAPMYELNWFAGFFFAFGPLGYSAFLFVEWLVLWFTFFALLSLLKAALRQMGRISVRFPRFG